MAATYGPLRGAYARVVTVTVVAQSAAELMAVNADVGCSVLVVNLSSSQLNVGGGDVDNSTKFVPVCSAATCVGTTLRYDGSAGSLYLRGASGPVTSVYLFAAGGC